VEWNHVRDTGREASDTGAIEMLGRSDRDTHTIIRYNQVDDPGGLEFDPSGRWIRGRLASGVYLDDLSSGVLVCGNLVRGAGLAAFQVHGGFNVVIRDNVAILDRPGARFVFFQNAQPEVPNHYIFDWARAAKAVLPKNGRSHLEIRYDNDAIVNGEDRDLYVSSVRIGSLVLNPEQARYRLDDGRELPGRHRLAWNGALIWDLPEGVPSRTAGAPVTVLAYGIPAGGIGAHFVVRLDGIPIGDAIAGPSALPMYGNLVTRNIVYAVRNDGIYYRWLDGGAPTISSNDYFDASGAKLRNEAPLADTRPLEINPRFNNPVGDLRLGAASKLPALGFTSLPDGVANENLSPATTNAHDGFP
jgi:Ca-dependent carbohydrate-binding module xylan-binding